VRSFEPETRERLRRVKAELWRAVAEPAPTYTVLFEDGTFLERGNGVLAVMDGRLARVGEVVRVRNAGPELRDLLATIAIDERTAEFRPRAGAVGVRRSQGRSFLFALQTLLPAARWRQVQEEWSSFRSRHAASLAHELEPLASELLAAALRAVAEELPDALERHRAEIDAVVARMREGLAQEQVRPLLVEELWPMVKRHAAAPMESVGRELWERVPLMSFALRAAADRLLEDEPVRVEDRWRRFVEEEALPTLRAHQPELEQAFAALVKDVLSSEPVQARATAAWEGVRYDPQVQALARALVRELLVENPRLPAAMKALAERPATKERVRRLGERFQEFFDPLGDLIFLDETGEGINPDLAWLIRLLLLRRDANVVYVEDGEGEPLPPGSELPGRHEP
jgi:hypothetical protein